MGGDLEDSTNGLQYTPMRSSTSAGDSLPQVIAEQLDPVFDAVRLGATGKDTYLLFLSPRRVPARRLFVHGPLTAARGAA